MNIFVVDTDPVQAAKDLCDQHVVKMTLESAQLLCAAFPESVTTPYKISHKQHPAAKWVRESRANFDWLVAHGLALGAEYTCRYGKIHKSVEVIIWCRDNSHQLVFTTNDLTPFALCMPNQYKTTTAVESYRAYYRSKTFAKWQHSSPPRWLQNG